MRLRTLLALTFCLLWPRGAAAHPLDEANIYHFFNCTLRPTTLHIEYKLLVGGLSMFKTWDSIDTDHNHVISASEKQAFADRMRDTLTLTLDDQPLALTLDSVDIPNYDDFIGGASPFLTLEFTAPWTNLKPGAHTLVLATTAFSDQTSSIFLPATLDAPKTWQATSKTATGEKGATVLFTLPAPVLKKPTTPTRPLPSGPNVPPILTALQDWNRENAEKSKPNPLTPFPAARYRSLKEGGDASSSALLLNKERRKAALASPFPVSEANAVGKGVGGLGSRVKAEPREGLGRSKVLQVLRPFLMGKGGVLAALGLAMVLGMGHALLPGHSKAVVGAYLIGARGTVSDAIFLGGVVTLAHTSIVLLFGVLMWKLERFAPERVQPWLQVGSGLLIVVLGIGLFLRGLLRWHGVGEGWTEAGENGPEEAFAYVPRPGATGRRQGKRRLLALGLAGGMVPCGDALILLLFAHAQGRTGFGLVLVTAFGLGMAMVLMGIGIALVKAGGLARRLRLGGSGRLLRAMPMVSAALIIVLGLWLTGEALLASHLILLNF